MKGYLLASALLVLLAFSVFRGQRQTREWEGRLAAATTARDIDRARTAEQIVKATAESDSLKRLLAGARGRLAAVTLNKDTVLIKLTDYVYIVDTVLPRCELCALRTDSLVEAMSAERRAGQHVENLMRREILAERKKKERWAKLYVPSVIGAAALGAWVRGQ